MKVAVSQARIAEYDVVRLKRAVGRWRAGTTGAVVSDHGSSKLIEISDERGQELDMIEVSEEDLALVEKYHR
jgi:Domain of unknown function (DUF4926)